MNTANDSQKRGVARRGMDKPLELESRPRPLLPKSPEPDGWWRECDKCGSKRYGPEGRDWGFYCFKTGCYGTHQKTCARWGSKWRDMALMAMGFQLGVKLRSYRIGQAENE